MRALLGTIMLMLVPVAANAGTDGRAQPARFVMSGKTIESVSTELEDGRFLLQSTLVARPGRKVLEGALLSLQARLSTNGAGCVPDSIFQDGFETLP